MQDLAIAVRLACGEHLAKFVNAAAVPPLLEPPADGAVFALPEPPSFDDAAAVEKWRDDVAWLSEQRARTERDAGVREGIARSIVDLLARRGVPPTAGEAARILECPDRELLDAWWGRALTVDSVEELFGG